MNPSTPSNPHFAILTTASLDPLSPQLRVLNMIGFFSLMFTAHRIATKFNRRATKTYRLDLLQEISEQWIDAASQLEMFEDLGERIPYPQTLRQQNLNPPRLHSNLDTLLSFSGFDYAVESGAHVNATLAQMYYPKSKTEKKNFVCNIYADVYRATSVVLASTGKMPALDFVFMNSSLAAGRP